MSKVPYASAISSLMYVMVCTRPDIARAVGVVSRFMSMPGKQHWEVVKWILKYLKGSLDTCLCFTGASLKQQGYVYVDFVGDIDSRNSTTGFVFILGGTAISWASNLQKIVTLSTTEVEYVAATEAGNEMIWLHCFLDELGKKQEMGILHNDSHSAIFLTKNLIFHSKSKHIVDPPPPRREKKAVFLFVLYIIFLPPRELRGWDMRGAESRSGLRGKIETGEEKRKKEKEREQRALQVAGGDFFEREACPRKKEHRYGFYSIGPLCFHTILL